MRKNGSQTRETLSEAGYRIDPVQGRDRETTIILNPIDQPEKRELWYHRPDFAGYVIEIAGKRYEFIRSL